jgi:hypothetical protein
VAWDRDGLHRARPGKRGEAPPSRVRQLRHGLADRAQSRAENSYTMICRSKRAPVMNKAASKVMIRDIPVPPSWST